MEIVKPRSTDELKPCPFCGCKEIVYGKYRTTGERWMVFCCGCDAAISPPFESTRFQAQEKWNRRFDFVLGLQR